MISAQFAAAPFAAAGLEYQGTYEFRHGGCWGL